MSEPKQKFPEVVRVLITTALVTAVVVGFGEYIYYTKPLQDELVKTQKETNTLREQLQAVIASVSRELQTYSNADYNFSFKYPETYEVASTSKTHSNLAPDAFAVLKKKDSADSVVAYMAVQKTDDAKNSETKFPEKVISSETTVGKNNISATSVSLLPGRGSEEGSSLHISRIIVPLKSVEGKSLVLTNVGDVDLATFQLVLGSLNVE